MKKALFITIISLGLSFWIHDYFTTAQDRHLFRISENNKVGYIDENGKIIIEPRFNNGGNFSEGLAFVRENGRFGYIDQAGKFVIQPKYDFATSFYDGIACVYINGRPMIIDKSGKIVLGTMCKSLQIIDRNNALVNAESGLQGIVNLTTKRLIADTIYRSVGNFYNGVAVVRMDGKDYESEFGVIDTLGNYIVPFGVFSEIDDFEDGFARVSIPDSTSYFGSINGVIDLKGNLVFKNKKRDRLENDADYFKGFALVPLHKYWKQEKNGNSASSQKKHGGNINFNDSAIINDTLSMVAFDFSDNRAFVYDKEGRFRIINTKFQTVGQNTFDYIDQSGFINNYAIVKSNDAWGVIDTNGNFLIEPKFQSLGRVGIDDYVYYRSSKENKGHDLYGIIRINGQEIAGPVITDIDVLGYVNGLLKVEINEKLTYIDKEGNIVWQENNNNAGRLTPLNVDYKFESNFFVCPTPVKDSYGWDTTSVLYPQKIANENFEFNSISVKVDVSQTDALLGRYLGYKVYVVNNTEKSIDFNVDMWQLRMKVQAKNEDGVWKEIESLPMFFGEGSFFALTLNPKNYCAFLTPWYEGEFKTKLRIEWKYIDPGDNPKTKRDRKEIVVYSNEYDGSVNPAQFWNKEGYQATIFWPYDCKRTKKSSAPVALPEASRFR